MKLPSGDLALLNHIYREGHIAVYRVGNDHTITRLKRITVPYYNTPTARMVFIGNNRVLVVMSLTRRVVGLLQGAQTYDPRHRCPRRRPLHHGRYRRGAQGLVRAAALRDREATR